MNDQLYNLSLDLLTAIYAGSQEDALKFAAEFRRIVLRARLEHINQLEEKTPTDLADTGDILSELGKLENVFPKGGE